MKYTMPENVVKIWRLICGCSDTTKTWTWILEYLTKCASEDSYLNDDDLSGGEILAMNLLRDLGFTEHGTSIRGSWITDNGKEIIEFINKMGIDWTDKYKCYGLGGKDTYMELIEETK